MRKFRPVESWVIYQTLNKGVIAGPKSVCGQAEWDEMERIRPGAQPIVRQGIASEGVAERLARGSSGDPVPRGSRMR